MTKEKKLNQFFLDGSDNPYRSLRKSLETSERPAPTQQELAKIFHDELGIEISQKQISMLESNGFNKVPDIKMIDAYRQYFNVSTDYLLGFSEYESVNLEMQRVSFVTGLSEKSLIVLDYLRKFKGVTNTDTGLVNYSTIRCLNNILESYYDETIAARDNYFSEHRFNHVCHVDTIFSRMDNYFHIDQAKCSLKNKEISFTRNNVSWTIGTDMISEMVFRELLIRELDKLRNDLKEGDADD